MSPSRARLNIFQKTQRLWDTIHPYNAAQAMELVGDFSSTQIDDAFNDAIRDLGLGEFECDGRSYRIKPTEAPVQVERPTGGFEAVMAREMNRPFDAAQTFPFRPFDLDDGGRRMVGLTYQHWVADSVSIRLLMRQWLRRLTGGGGPCRVRLPSSGLLGTFGPATAGWSVVAQTASLFTLSSKMRKMRRVDETDNSSVRVLLRDGPDNLGAAVRERARSFGATVGDVFLAAAAVASDLHGPGHATRRRPGLCLGTIVDLRARRASHAADVFGLFLGFTMTEFGEHDLSSFDHLLKRTAASRRTGLSRKSAEASQLNLTLGYAIARKLRPKKLQAFYRKRFPLAGGLSSVNMTPGWAGDSHPSPLAAYHRVSPTGPMLPIVLTPTTLGRTFRVCCTYRPSLLNEHRAEAFVQTFVDTLRQFAGR